jgi:hypothetical protein
MLDWFSVYGWVLVVLAFIMLLCQVVRYVVV